MHFVLHLSSVQLFSFQDAIADSNRLKIVLSRVHTHNNVRF
jgi:hypothetical protein